MFDGAYQRGKEAALKDYAPGLPTKKDFGDLASLKPGMQVDFVVHLHDAERAGKHRDVRFGTKNTGLFSWATKKDLPEPGKSIALFRQPVHRFGYKDFEGDIASGYGKGKVEIEDTGKLLINKLSPRSVQFSRIDRRGVERYLIVKPSAAKPWLLKNVTPTEVPPHEKEHYRLQRKLELIPAGAVVQPKVDGASTLLTIKAPDKLELTSFRTSKSTGYPIVHTERVLPAGLKKPLPKALVGTVLRGEIYGLRDGKAVTPAELSGVLNSTVENALESGVKLKTMLFDVRKHEGKDVSKLPYPERLDILRSTLPFLATSTRGIFHLPETATTQAAAEKMLAEIKAGKNPLTREGVVVHALTPEQSRKVKLDDEHDVYLRGVSSDKASFAYSFTPKGEIVGRVGSGLTDLLRKDLLAYVGRRARVRAQEKLPSGALRAPVFIALHEG